VCGGKEGEGEIGESRKKIVAKMKFG